jgi:mycoredoxin-dependent peroxiredoxin
MTDLIKTGLPAPGFTLPNQDGNDVSLSNFRGQKRVLLAFYGMDFETTATSDNKKLSDMLDDFARVDAHVLAIGVNGVESHRAWAESMGFCHTLLSDRNGVVSRMFGVLQEELRTARRATVIIDRWGIVSYVHLEGGKEERDCSHLIEVLKDIP